MIKKTGMLATKNVLSFCFSPIGDECAIFFNNKKLCFYNIDDLERPLKEINPWFYFDGLKDYSLRWSSNGRYISIGRHEKILLIDIQNNYSIKVIPKIDISLIENIFFLTTSDTKTLKALVFVHKSGVWYFDITRNYLSSNLFKKRASEARKQRHPSDSGEDYYVKHREQNGKKSPYWIKTIKTNYPDEVIASCEESGTGISFFITEQEEIYVDDILERKTKLSLSKLHVDIDYQIKKTLISEEENINDCAKKLFSTVKGSIIYNADHHFRQTSNYLIIDNIFNKKITKNTISIVDIQALFSSPHVQVAPIILPIGLGSPSLVGRSAQQTRSTPNPSLEPCFELEIKLSINNLYFSVHDIWVAYILKENLYLCDISSELGENTTKWLDELEKSTSNTVLFQQIRTNLEQKAREGDHDAIFNLAECYYAGRHGFLKNNEEAIKLYRSLANKASRAALYKLGYVLQEKSEDKKDILRLESIYCYKWSSFLGYIPATRELYKLKYHPLYLEIDCRFTIVEKIKKNVQSNKIIRFENIKISTIEFSHYLYNVDNLDTLSLQNCEVNPDIILSIANILNASNAKIDLLDFSHNKLMLDKTNLLIKACKNKVKKLDLRFNDIYFLEEEQSGQKVNDFFSSIPEEIRTIYLAGNYMPLNWGQQPNIEKLNFEFNLGHTLRISQIKKDWQFSDSRWIVYLIKKSDIRVHHAFLALEGIFPDKNQCFHQEFHLYMAEVKDNARIEICTKEPVFVYKKNPIEYTAVAYSISSTQGLELIQNVNKHKIQAENGEIGFSYYAGNSSYQSSRSTSSSTRPIFNCFEWSKYQLGKIGIEGVSESSLVPLPMLQLIFLQIREGQMRCTLQ